MQDLRRLDFDDLLLLQQLAEGDTLTRIAKTMNISQPAISQRLRKIEDVFAIALVKQDGRRVQLTEAGLALAINAGGALKLMQSLPSGQNKAVINIGTRPEVGFSWLGKALLNLRKSQPDLTFHVHVASGSEILQRLGTGHLDAVLTSAPITVRDFRSLELVEEKYVFAATRQKFEGLKRTEDFTSEVLIEYDRSFPFLRYLDADLRAKISFRDVWFLGSTVLMANAIAHGFGIGIVPRYLLEEPIRKGSVQVLPQTKSVRSDSFRIIHRNDPLLEKNLQFLRKELVALGLC